MRRRPLLLAQLFGLLLLGACASVPAPHPAARDAVENFTVEARFALRVLQPGQSAQSAGGRMTWTHDRNGNRILLASPLGVGIAEIETTPRLSSLRTAEGKTMHSPDADALIEEVTGQRLPVTRLPAWLLGRANAGARIERDAAGRPLRLDDAGWRIDYAYDEDAAEALPSRLTLSREGEVELRLRIEEWRSAP